MNTRDYRPFLNCVSFTGVDDYTNLKQLEHIYEQYPFLEFGICFDMPKNSHINYAGYRLLNTLQSYPHLPWVAHLSEKNVEFLFSSFQVDYLKVVPWRRIQINIDLLSFLKVNKTNALFKHIDKLRKDTSHFGQIILPENLQSRLLLRSTKIPSYIDILSDVSGGKGIVPSLDNDWAAPYHSRFGFAGGISLQNLKMTLDKIQKNLNPNVEFTWIDMESSLKNPETGLFDLEKAKLVAQHSLDVIKNVH